jgi:hypothetical protein
MIRTSWLYAAFEYILTYRVLRYQKARRIYPGVTPPPQATIFKIDMT